MSVDALNKEDTLLIRALHTAKQALQAAKLGPYVEERMVRTILRDIPCDARQPLPVSISVYLPGDTPKIMSAQQIADIIAEIDLLGNTLIRK